MQLCHVAACGVFISLRRPAVTKAAASLASSGLSQDGPSHSGDYRDRVSGQTLKQTHGRGGRLFLERNSPDARDP